MFYNTASVLWGFFGQEAHGIPSRDQNRTPCIGRQSLNPWTPSEVPKTFVFRTSPVSELRWGEPEGAGWLQCRSPGPSPRGSNSVAAGGGLLESSFKGRHRAQLRMVFVPHVEVQRSRLRVLIPRVRGDGRAAFCQS